MADYDELFMPESVRQSGDVVRQLDNVVGFDLRRTIAAAVAALVRDSDLEPGFDDRIDLMPPEIPELRETVQEDDKWAFAFDHGAQADAVRFDQLKITFLHSFFSRANAAS